MAAVAVAGAAVLSITGTIGIAHIIVISLVIGVTDAGGNPARNALMADLVGRERIARANALSVAGALGSRMIAPAIAGTILAFAGSAPALLFAAAWYLASVVATYGIADSRPGDPLAVGVTPRQPVRRSGVRTVIWVTAASNVLVWPAVFTFLPVFAEDVFQAGPEGTGVVDRGQWTRSNSRRGACRGPPVMCGAAHCSWPRVLASESALPLSPARRG